jgi:hypothetical protein
MGSAGASTPTSPRAQGADVDISLSDDAFQRGARAVGGPGTVRSGPVRHPGSSPGGTGDGGRAHGGQRRGPVERLEPPLAAAGTGLRAGSEGGPSDGVSDRATRGRARGRVAGRKGGRAPAPPAPLAVARTCYDHLAGVLGVQILDGLFAAGALTRPDRSTGEVLVARRAVRVFEELGVDVGHAAAGRRRFAFGCRDWTERRPHLGGSLGAAICRRFFDAGWVVRPGDTRAVLLTREGREVLTEVLGVASTRPEGAGVRGGRAGRPAAEGSGSVPARRRAGSRT